MEFPGRFASRPDMNDKGPYHSYDMGADRFQDLPAARRSATPTPVERIGAGRTSAPKSTATAFALQAATTTANDSVPLNGVERIPSEQKDGRGAWGCCSICCA